MRKPYSLDFNLKTDTERLEAVNDIVSSTTRLRPKDLELLTDYILYGIHGTTGRNNFADGTMLSPASPPQRTGHVSLDELLECPNGFDHTRLTPLGPSRYTVKTKPVTRPHIDANGERIDDGDEGVPGMRELWNSIDSIIERLKELGAVTSDGAAIGDPSTANGLTATDDGAAANDPSVPSGADVKGLAAIDKDGMSRKELATDVPSAANDDVTANVNGTDATFSLAASDTTPINYPYLVHRLKHALKELRQDQYLLRDAYNPPLHFQRPNSSLGSGPNSPSVNFDQDSAYWISEDELTARLRNYREPALGRNPRAYARAYDPDSEETMVRWVVREQEFDWENPEHIRALLNLYSAIWEQNYEKPLSWGQTLIYDFDRYFNLSHFSPIQEYVVTLHVDGLSADAIIQKILENPQFGFKYSKNQIYNIIKKQIPNGIALTAKKLRLMHDTPDYMKKKCKKCGRLLPKSTVFFTVNMSRADHLNGRCKECERAMRIGTHDKRFKSKIEQNEIEQNYATDFGNILDTPRINATEK